LVRGVVKYKYSDTGHLLNLNPTITSYVSGKVNLSGDEGELSVMPVGVFVYDLEAAQVSGSYVTKFLRGYFNIGPETTT
jgi:hypothetical protein